MNKTNCNESNSSFFARTRSPAFDILVGVLYLTGALGGLLGFMAL